MPQTSRSRRSVLVVLAGGAASAALPRLAQAQSFPSKPLKIVNPYAPGGPGDALCRTVAALLSTQLGQPVIVESKTGGSGSIGTLAKGVGFDWTMVAGISFRLQAGVIRMLP